MGTAPRLALVAALTVLSTAAGLALNRSWLLPVLNALPAYGIMLDCLRRGRRTAAIGLMIWWALWLALASVTFSMTWHGRAESVILNGSEYRDEMLGWISTGMGRESTPSEFIPQHLLHALLFCGLSLLTGGAVSILMGAILMNYMSFYVGDMIARCAGSSAHAAAIFLAWNPWSIIRVLSFIILGVVLAEPLLSRLKGAWPTPQGRWLWIAAGAGGLLLDIILKALLAPLWPGMLRGCLG